MSDFQPQSAPSRDTSQSKDMNEILRRERELTDFVENATVGMHWVGPDGIVLWANRCELDLLGCRKDEYIGHHISDFHAEAPVIAEMLARLSAGEELHNFEARLRRKDGGIRHVLINSNVLWDGDRFVHTRCFTRDITDRRFLQDALEESELRFRSMADSAPVLIWMAGTDALCEYLNRPWLEFRGRTLAQEIGSGWTEGLHPEDLKPTLDTCAAAYRARSQFRMEYRLRRHDGSYRWMLVTGTPRFAPDGGFSGFIGSCIDITEMKETEAQFRQSQKMESVGLLAGGIAHDFNNLLTAINGYSDLALAKLEGQTTLTEYLQEIRNSGERAASLTQQLLAFSRKQILAPVRLNLNTTVTDMQRMLQRLIGEDIELITVLEPELDSVRADPGQFQQILLNLALNARDAMPNGGRLTLETANVVLDKHHISTRLEAKPGRHVLLAVSDTGIGMSEAVKARIFEPFFTTKEVGRGTGLGLSSVYGIIKQSEGSIAVFSEAGQGTTFKIYLPIVVEAKSDERGVPDPAAKADTSGSGSILLVEDEHGVRKYVAHALTSVGYTVQQAKNAEEALDILKSGTMPELLLTDVVMPGMNGRQLAGMVKSKHPGMAVLFMSGYTETAIVHNGVLDADADFLPKPFTQAELLGKVRQVLASAPGRSSAVVS
jgi:two-component system, cell cycle sensor histidine kinase and response regulator CckA